MLQGSGNKMSKLDTEDVDKILTITFSCSVSHKALRTLAVANSLVADTELMAVLLPCALCEI